MLWEENRKFFEANGYWSGVAHPIAVARKYRRYLLETREHRCEICKLDRWLNEPIPLVMDHVDGKPENWSLANLRLICGNCDMLLPTHKNKNRGNGRGYRRARYAEGKTY